MRCVPRVSKRGRSEGGGEMLVCRRVLESSAHRERGEPASGQMTGDRYRGRRVRRCDPATPGVGGTSARGVYRKLDPARAGASDLRERERRRVASAVYSTSRSWRWAGLARRGSPGRVSFCVWVDPARDTTLLYVWSMLHTVAPSRPKHALHTAHTHTHDAPRQMRESRDHPWEALLMLSAQGACPHE